MKKDKLELEKDKEEVLQMLGEADEKNKILTGELEELKETVKNKDEEIESLRAKQNLPDEEPVAAIVKHHLASIQPILDFVARQEASSSQSSHLSHSRSSQSSDNQSQDIKDMHLCELDEALNDETKREAIVDAMRMSAERALRVAQEKRAKDLRSIIDRARVKKKEMLDMCSNNRQKEQLRQELKVDLDDPDVRIFDQAMFNKVRDHAIQRSIFPAAVIGELCNTDDVKRYSGGKGHTGPYMNGLVCGRKDGTPARSIATHSTLVDTYVDVISHVKGRAKNDPIYTKDNIKGALTKFINDQYNNSRPKGWCILVID